MSRIIIKDIKERKNTQKKIICPSDSNCTKTPKIELIFCEKNVKIKTDCGVHQYELHLTDYLKTVDNAKIEHQICNAHKEPFSYYCEICKNDFCYKCSDDKRHNKLYFLKLLSNCETYNKIDINNIISEMKQIIDIIINEYKDASNKNKLNYSIIVNYEYILKNQNLFLETSSKYESLVNSYTIDNQNNRT